MTVYATADLCDQFGEAVQVCRSPLRNFGVNRPFEGPIATIRCFRDNGLIRETLRTAGEGRILVVDAGGVLDCALVGGDLGGNATSHGWAGIIVNGAVRDLAELAQLPIGVRALGAWPGRATRDGSGDQEITVTFGEVTFAPGHWLCADQDGLVVMKTRP
ncbi:MAG: ribonuclease E activity regulator RraA [Pseudomonadales bacterium]|nr:ribonuclease E activity regulator RraA [Pseudomonadales bacterium]